jgi:hypothetical protein
MDTRRHCEKDSFVRILLQLKRILFVLVLAMPVTAKGDASDEPGGHFFVAPSPGNKFHAVHTVRRWKDVPNLSQFGRVQIFETETGREVWRIEGVIVEDGGVFPADDGVHLVILQRTLWGLGDRMKRDQPIIQFYARDRLLKSYTLDDLHIDPKELPHSVSHTQYYRYQSMLPGWAWEWELGSEAAETNIRYGIEANPIWRDGAFHLKTADGQQFRFDPSGKRLPLAKK